MAKKKRVPEKKAASSRGFQFRAKSETMQLFTLGYLVFHPAKKISISKKADLTLPILLVKVKNLYFKSSFEIDIFLTKLEKVLKTSSCPSFWVNRNNNKNGDI